MVQSEDVGRPVSSGAARGFEIVGRARGAEPRGCSLSAEEFAAGSTHGKLAS
jgi:hypothetical protein